MHNPETLFKENNTLKHLLLDTQEQLAARDAQIHTYETKLTTYQAQLEHYKDAHEQMRHQLAELMRYRFGRKSERVVDPDNPQMNFFGLLDGNDAASVHSKADEEQPDQDETVTVPEHKRRKTNPKNTDNLPRHIEIIPVSDEHRVCHCGCQKQLVRYEITERHDYQPEVFRIVEERREIMACSKGCEHSLTTAPLPKRVLPKIKATESLLAHIITAKLQHRQPLYHLEKYTNLVGISRETMARWMIQLVEPLQPLYNLLKDDVIAYEVASLDATTLRVLKEPNRAPSTQSYVYCIRGGPPERQAILYDYNYEKHKVYVDTWFEGFQGYVHMDADPFFETLLEDKNVHAVFCHAHARRKFEAITKQVKKQGLAHEAVRYYKRLYRIERDAKDKAMTPDERYRYRLEHSKPLLEDFKQWLDRQYPLVLPSCYLGKAMAYCLKRWNGFLLFLEDGRLEIDNNLTEQAIKPFVIARKNFMFADSMKGARALCLHFSLIRTATAHNLNAYHYYTEILKKIPHCETVEDYEALLPWNITF